MLCMRVIFNTSCAQTESATALGHFIILIHTLSVAPSNLNFKVYIKWNAKIEDWSCQLQFNQRSLTSVKGSLSVYCNIICIHNQHQSLKFLVNLQYLNHLSTPLLFN